MEKSKGQSSDPIDLYRFLFDVKRCLRRFWPFFLLLTGFSGVASYLWFQAKVIPEYQAFTSFVVSSGKTYRTSYYDNVAAEQLEKMFPYLISSGVLRDMTEKDLGVSSLSSVIKAEVVEDTNLFTIRVTDSSPERTYEVLQAVIRNFPKAAEYLTGSISLTVVDESGVPEKPLASHVVFTGTVRGTAMGAGVSLLFLLLSAIAGKTIHSQEDLKKVTGIRYLGKVPEVKRKKRSSRQGKSITIQNTGIPDGFREAVRSLRSRTEEAVRKSDSHILLVTSALPGEGKTTLAGNLALAFAEKNYKVLLMDGDLRHPSVLQEMGIPGEERRGWNDVLKGSASLEEILVHDVQNTITIVPCTGAIPDPAALLLSVQMKELMGKLKEKADLIILDAPPSGMMRDTVLLGQYATDAILVVQSDRTERRQVQRALEVLGDGGISVLGYVLNRVAESHTGYGSYAYGSKYGYGHSYGYR